MSMWRDQSKSKRKISTQKDWEKFWDAEIRPHLRVDKPAPDLATIKNDPPVSGRKPMTLEEALLEKK